MSDHHAPGGFVPLPHAHAWSGGESGWPDLSTCHQCGLTMIQLFTDSSTWVARRVEKVAFLDECTVRRRVSIDYEAPSEALLLRRPSGDVRVLPLAILRRKSLVNFDFRDAEGRALPLLGLRQNQALTLAIVRAWAAASLSEQGCREAVSPGTDEFLDDVIAGDHTELFRAFKRMWDAKPGTQLQRLGTDQLFRSVLNRLADSFLLYGLHEGPVGERCLVKFSYDEALTLRYAKPSYRLTSEGGCQDEYENTHLHPLGWTTIRAAMGFSPTLIEFPVPAAELAASFHFEISAPPEVSIVRAALLAGRPKPEPILTEITPRASGDDRSSRAGMKNRRRRRPSFDSFGGGDPTVDLHVAEVPYGSRSRACVEVEARVGGWFATAVFSSWLATGILLFAWLVRPELAVGSALLMSFSAALVAILVRPDPHRLVTRLLSKVRLLATFTALLSFAAAAVVAFVSRNTAHTYLQVLLTASLASTVLISSSWLLAVSRSVRGNPRESPWEHHRPRRSRLASEDPAQGQQAQNEARHETLSRKMEEADHPYDLPHRKLRFNRPAIRVASGEGDRQRHLWSEEFAGAFRRRLSAYHDTLAAVERRAE